MTPNMIFRPISLTIVVFLALLLGNVSTLAQFDPQHIRAVDQNAPGGPGDLGATWDNAYVFLKDAIVFASDPDNDITEIWVAAGTYVPDRDAANPGGTGNKDATFLLDFIILLF